MINVPPPPQLPQEDVPAIYQQFESPEQSPMYHIDGNTVSIEQPKEAQPDNGQQMQDLHESVEGIGEGAAALAKAKNDADRRKEENAAITGNKDIAAGTGPEPASGEDPGNDYYNGYGY